MSLLLCRDSSGEAAVRSVTPRNYERLRDGVLAGGTDAASEASRCPADFRARKRPLLLLRDFLRVKQEVSCMAKIGS